MELFFDSKSIVLKDYVHLSGYGLPSSFSSTTSVADRGHEALITSFFDSVKSSPFTPPINLQHLLNVAELTLIIDKLACEGGGNKELM